jgi:hypothetical protein
MPVLSAAEVNAQIQTLKADVEADLKAIAEIYAKLAYV